MPPAAEFLPVSPAPSVPLTGSAPLRRRRVIFVNRFFLPDISATSQLLADLVGSLGDAPDYELHVICSRQLYDSPDARLEAEAVLDGVRIHRCWSARFGRDRLIGRGLDYLSFFLSSTLAMLRWVQDGDIVVAMTDPPMISVCAALVAKLKRAMLINWLQDIFPEVATALEVRMPQWAMPMLRTARNWSLRAAHRNVVLGHRMRQFIERQGVPYACQQIIENWADGVALTPRSSQCSALRQSVDGENQFVIQYSGNLGRAHEFQTMLAAASQLQQEPGWLFVFVGGGANMRRLQAQAGHQGVTNMRFLPYRPREALADSLAAADVHLSCLLPQMEGLIVPSKFYGVLAAGRPIIVIGDPDGEQARIVRAEDCGIAVRCGDSGALVDALRGIRADPEWLQSAGYRARALFERRYTSGHAAAKWRRMLDTISAKAAQT